MLWIVVAAGVAGSASAREVVGFKGGVAPGTIVVKTAERRLYFVIGEGSAMRYRVAVGRPTKQWFGQVEVAGKHLRPAWSPPEEVRLDNPNLPDVIPGGAPNNPMGLAALPFRAANTPSTAPTGQSWRTVEDPLSAGEKRSRRKCRPSVRPFGRRNSDRARAGRRCPGCPRRARTGSWRIGTSCRRATRRSPGGIDLKCRALLQCRVSV